MNPIDVDQRASPLARPWVAIVGAVIGTLTLLFFMALVVMGIFGREVPCGSTYLVNVTLSLGAALAAGFLGGNASAKGTLSLPILQQSPLVIGISGGVAVLIIVLVVSTQMFGRGSCDPAVSMSCSQGSQGHVVEPLRFGFCYPREGWELDSGPIGIRAADIYLRHSANRDVGVHFHVALIPPAWAGKPAEYTAEVARTWRQLDENLNTSRTFIGGREAFHFALHVKDRKGITRPTEVTHIYLDSERLLEIISTIFKETSEKTVDEIQMIKSSLVFART